MHVIIPFLGCCEFEWACCCLYLLVLFHQVRDLRKLVAESSQLPIGNLKLILRGKILDDCKNEDDVLVRLNHGGIIAVFCWLRDISFCCCIVVVWNTICRLGFCSFYCFSLAHDPMKKQNCSSVPAILYFFEKTALVMVMVVLLMILHASAFNMSLWFKFLHITFSLLSIVQVTGLPFFVCLQLCFCNSTALVFSSIVGFSSTFQFKIFV